MVYFKMRPLYLFVKRSMGGIPAMSERATLDTVSTGYSKFDFTTGLSAGGSVRLSRGFPSELYRASPRPFKVRITPRRAYLVQRLNVAKGRRG